MVHYSRKLRQYIYKEDNSYITRVKSCKVNEMENSKRIMRIFGKFSDIVHIRIFGTFVTVGMVLLLVAGISVAAVFVVYEYPTSTTGTSAKIYLQEGPNYVTASGLGLVSGGASLSSTSGSGTTLGINTVSGSQSVYLLNVLEVVNTSSGITGHVYLYINGTLPSGVTLYFDNTTQMAFSGTNTGTYSIVQGTGTGNGTLVGGVSAFSAKIPLTKTFTVYLSFVLTGAAVGSGTLYLQTSIG